MCQVLFDSWKKGEGDVWYDTYHEVLVTPNDLNENDKKAFSEEMAMRDEVKKTLPKIRQTLKLDEDDDISESGLCDFMDNYIPANERQFVTYGEWEDYCCEWYENYVTEKVIDGVTVVAFGYYGHD